jgi:lipid-binding SYLF domain-containing protein
MAAAMAFGPAAIAADMAQNSAATLRSDGQKTLNSLYAKVPAAKQIGGKASAVLVFPKVTKAGLGIGGQYGEGVLLKGGKPVAYYNTAGVSTGLQAGAQTFGYAMFFMNDAALKALDRTEGFEVGVGPSVVLVDEGMAKTTTTTTLDKDVYAFIFSQKGLMAGLGIQGNKITKIHPK